MMNHLFNAFLNLRFPEYERKSVCYDNMYMYIICGLHLFVNMLYYQWCLDMESYKFIFWHKLFGNKLSKCENILKLSVPQGIGKHFTHTKVVL